MDAQNELKQRSRFWTVPVLAAVGLTGVVLWWFFANQTGFGYKKLCSVWVWLNYRLSDPKEEMDYGWLVPVLAAVMVGFKYKLIKEAPKWLDWRGLLPVVLGGVIYVVAYRMIQPRVGVFAFPIILWGSIWYLAGARVARLVAFPVLFLWLMMPLFSFQAYTVPLQIMATELGHWGASVFGVDSYVQGTSIYSSDGKWDAYTVTGGCSGMRSLMSLSMISMAWAYIAPMSWWKKCLLVFSTLPLAVIGNGFRLTSIFVLAEYVSPVFASKTWHDWSGLLFFFPCSLLGMMLIYAWMVGEIPWLAKHRRQVVVITKK